MGNTCVFRSTAISIPEGDARTALLERLAELSIDGGSSGELRDYVAADLDRFMYTLGLVPEGAQGLGLEIGANPYFMSVIMRDFRPHLRFEYVNFFDGAGDSVDQSVRWRSKDGDVREEHFVSLNRNLEVDSLPVEEKRYDVILFCEVLEHFTQDPLRCVSELRRVLKDGGLLVLTTPNVARFENVAALIDGRNLYDPYSGYGPHGRHNREYTRHELHMLMRHAGFACKFDFTSDVHPNIPSSIASEHVVEALQRIQHREHDLGQYLFSCWVKADDGLGNERPLPRWLYRSYPEHRFE